MTRSKYLLVPTITASLLVLAGCTAQTATNTNVVANTNADNANVEVEANTNTANTNVVVNTNENTNVVLANENTNKEKGDEVNTGDWQTYSNEVIGLQFDYPMPSSNMYFDFTDCSEVQCDSETGFSYSLIYRDEEGGYGYAVVGASTLDFVAGGGLSYFDVVFFRNDSGNFEAAFSKDNSFTINPVKQASYANGEVVIYEIKDLPGYNQLVDVAIERKDDKVAIYNFNQDINGFKSISVLLTPEMTEQDIDRILTSIAIVVIPVSTTSALVQRAERPEREHLPLRTQRSLTNEVTHGTVHPSPGAVHRHDVRHHLHQHGAGRRHHLRSRQR